MRRYFSDVSWLAVPGRPGRPLIEHPQMLGIAPTLWFWTRRDVIGRTVLLAIPLAALGACLRARAGGTLLDTIAFALLSSLWGLGVAERGLRILLHRRAAVTAEGEETPPPAP